MLATVMNALAMRDALERSNIASRVMSAIPMSGVVDHYDRRKAIRSKVRARAVPVAAHQVDLGVLVGFLRRRRHEERTVDAWRHELVASGLVVDEVEDELGCVAPQVEVTEAP